MCGNVLEKLLWRASGIFRIKYILFRNETSEEKNFSYLKRILIDGWLKSILPIEVIFLTSTIDILY